VSWNVCCRSVQNVLYSSLLSKNVVIHIHRTVILSFVLYGCETWSVTLKEEHSLRVFGNGVLRGICGSNRGEVTGDWRKLHNEQLHYCFRAPDIIRVNKSRNIRWAWRVACMRKNRKYIQNFCGET
jgi:hypothetical protein